MTYTIDDDTSQVVAITKANIIHTILDNELPRELKSFASIFPLHKNDTFNNLKKMIDDDLTHEGLDFQLNMAYTEATKNNAIHLYQYGEFCRVKFDAKLLNHAGQTLYISFIRNTKMNSQPWFCLGLWHTDFFYDLIDIDRLKLDKNYQYLTKYLDFSSEESSIRAAVVNYVSNKFYQNIETNNILEYNNGERTFIEYSLDIVDENGGVIYAQFEVMSKSPSARKPWIFLKFIAHNGDVYKSIKNSVDEAINYQKNILDKIEEEREAALDESILNSNITEDEDIKIEVETQKPTLSSLEMKEKLCLRPFTNIKIAHPKVVVETYGNFGDFADIAETTVQKVVSSMNHPDIKNEGDFIACMFRTYSRCYQNNEISYYTDASKIFTAELKSDLITPDGDYYYFCFRENRFFKPEYYNPNNIYKGPKQWHFSYVRDGGKIHDFTNLSGSKRILEKLKNVCPDALDDSWDVNKLLTCINDGFMKALSNPESFLYYREDKNQRIEIPIDIFVGDKQVYILFFRSEQSLNRLHIKNWTFSSFRLRSADPIPEIYYEMELLKENREKSSKQKLANSAQSSTESDDIPETISPNQTIIYPLETPTYLRDFCPKIGSLNWKVLADAAEAECWSDEHSGNLGILKKYLNDRFYRLSVEKKVLISTTPGCTPRAAMHTGLYTRDFHAPIYGFFRQTTLGTDDLGQDILSWRLIDFVNRWDGGDWYDLFTNNFPTEPENVDFLRENGEYVPIHHYVFDPTIGIDLNQIHVLNERGYRLPIDFFKALCKRAEEDDLISALEDVEAEEDSVYQKERWNEFYDKLIGNEALEKKISDQVKYLIQDALHSNTFHAITIYYSMKNTIEWLLPLHVSNSDTQNITGLVIEKKIGSNKYKGTTLMDVDAYYAKARVVKKPCDAWFPRHMKLMEKEKTIIDYDEDELNKYEVKNWIDRHDIGYLEDDNELYNSDGDVGDMDVDNESNESDLNDSEDDEFDISDEYDFNDYEMDKLDELDGYEFDKWDEYEFAYDFHK